MLTNNEFYSYLSGELSKERLAKRIVFRITLVSRIQFFGSLFLGLALRYYLNDIHFMWVSTVVLFACIISELYLVFRVIRHGSIGLITVFLNLAPFAIFFIGSYSVTELRRMV